MIHTDLSSCFLEGHHLHVSFVWSFPPLLCPFACACRLDIFMWVFMGFPARNFLWVFRFIKASREDINAVVTVGHFQSENVAFDLDIWMHRDSIEDKHRRSYGLSSRCLLVVIQDNDNNLPTMCTCSCTCAQSLVKWKMWDAVFKFHFD